jgi:hypothetical protein
MLYFFFHTDKKLYATTNALMAAGKTRSNIDNAVAQQSKAIAACKLLELGKSNYFKWDDMSNGWRESVEARFGNPYHFIGKQPILDMLVEDLEAAKFYLAYRYGNEKALSTKKIKQYTRAAAWLVMVHNAQQNNNAIIKKQLQMSIPQFFDNCKLLIEKEIENGKNDDYAYNDELTKGFAYSYQRLKANAATFKEKGFEFLIDDMLDNNRSAKINDELSESVLKGFMTHSNKLDYARIAQHYNKWAKEENYKPIEPQTARLKAKLWGFEIDMEREGASDWYEKHSTVIKGRKISVQYGLVECDDNDIDMYFYEETIVNGKLVKNYYKRVKMIVVTDVSCGLYYPLGWAYGDTVSVELVRAAWLDAMHHVRDLTGDWYLPHQIKNDRWAMAALEPFYNDIDPEYFKTAAKSKRSKLIEQSFGKNWHADLKEIAVVGYAGTNITSAGRLNREALEFNTKRIPDISKAPVYISAFMHKIRSRVDATGATLQQRWLANFKANPRSQERLISHERMLLIFGTKHIVKSARLPLYPNQITNEGIVAKLVKNKEFTYDIPDYVRKYHKGKQVQLIYDPMDYSKVLVTDNDDLRFIATATYEGAKARVDYTEKDEQVYWAKMHEKKQLVEWVKEQRANKDKILLTNKIDIEGRLQAGILLKETKQLDEATYQEMLYSKPVVEVEYVEVEQSYNVTEKRLQR